MANNPLSQLDEETQMSSSPASPQSSSDKENPRRINKRSNTRMAPLQVSSKRRRLGERAPNTQSQVPSSQRNSDKKYYDPDQDVGERRRVRQGFRELTRNFNDSRDEYLQPGNNRMKDIVEDANRLFDNVKQTSDATLDSRLLVNAADLSHKKTAQLVLGDSTVGIDVDEFVSKCISFMRRGPGTSSSLPHSTSQRRRPRQSQIDADESDEDDEGDAMNWDWQGRMACFPSNARPSVSGWLLGPLSVQKRTRQVTQRTQTERIDPTRNVQPQDLHQEDLQQENSNLTVMCAEIHKLLAETQGERQREVDKLLSRMGDPSPEEVQRVMDEHCVADDGGIPLFNFCINPKSFGQSVENLFYVSFLVRDGHVGVSTDSRGLPTLISAIPYAPSEAQRRGIQKHQAIFSLDFETFEELVKVFNIKKSIIEDRGETQHETNLTWYG